MGKMYARYFKQSSAVDDVIVTRINVCDVPSKYQVLKEEYAELEKDHECPIIVHKDGFGVVRRRQAHFACFTR